MHCFPSFKYYRITLCLLMAYGIVACEQDNMPAPDKKEGNPPVLTFKTGSTNRQASAFDNTLLNTTYKGNDARILEIIADHNTGASMQISIIETPPGNSNNKISETTYAVNGSTHIINATYFNENQTYTTNNNKNNSGFVRVSRCNAEHQTTSGSFDFYLYNTASGDSIHIKNGIFENLSYTSLIQ